MTTEPLTITLADATRWCLRAVHPEAVPVINALRKAMQLKPGREGRELLVTVGEVASQPPVNLAGPGSAICPVPPPFDNDLCAIGMFRICLAIGREIQTRGGLLLHGALIEIPPAASTVQPKPGEAGPGILLAGAHGAGKTTASNRVPDPWRALCDDTTLIVPDRAGHYWAHPWPTWSRFYSVKGVPGPGGTWNVQRPVPLQAIFFLKPSSMDRAAPLSLAPAVAVLMTVAQHVSHLMRWHLSDDEIQALHEEQLMAVGKIMASVPVFSLEHSLTGAFWEEIARVLKKRKKAELPQTPYRKPVGSLKPDHSSPASADEKEEWQIVYTGPSMNPTLRGPDLLTVDPYDDRPIKTGDVIYYHWPKEDRPIVHRVIRITSNGIRTRGDNNRHEDPVPIPPEAVLGRVAIVQRGQSCRRVAGGFPGRLTGAGCRLRLLAGQPLIKPLRLIYRGLARSGLFQKLLPPGMRPRLFLFQSRQQSFLKLMIKGRVVGQYDTLWQQWRFRRPYRLFVDADSLPRPGNHDLYPGMPS